MKNKINIFEFSLTYIALTLIMTGGLIHIRRFDFNTNHLQGDPIAQIIFSLIYVVVLLLLVPHIKMALIIIKKEKWLILLMLLAALSIFWSSFPEISIRRIIAISGTIILGLYLSLRFTFRQQLYLLAFASITVIILSVITVFLAPDIGIYNDFRGANAWQGILGHKNEFGRHMVLSSAVILLLLALTKRLHRKIIWGVVLSISVLMMINSYSVTSYVTFACMMLLLPFLYQLRLPTLLKYSFFTMVFIGISSIAVFTVTNVNSILTVIDRDLTFTGRDQLWLLTWQMALQKPLFGYGYGSFWVGWEDPSYSIYKYLHWEPPHAHNGFIDLMLELGFIGLIVFLIGYLLTIARSVKYIRSELSFLGFWPILFLVLFFIINLSESTIMRQNNIFWVMYCAITFSLVKEQYLNYEKRNIK